MSNYYEDQTVKMEPKVQLSPRTFHLRIKRRAFLTPAYLLMMWLLIVNVSPALGQQSTNVQCGDGKKCRTIHSSGKKSLFCTDLESIPKADDDLGCNVQELEIINITSSNIVRLEENAFGTHAIKLKQIAVRRSRVAAILSGAFRELQGLQVLDLTGNDLMTLNVAVFNDCPNLIELYLGGNKIYRIDGTLPLPALQILDLSSNSLGNLPRDFFIRSIRIKELSLMNNEFKSIGGDDLRHLTDLKDLEVSGNSWECDCKLLSVYDWIMQDENRKLQFLSKFTCKSPKYLEAKSWNSNFERDDLSCQSITKVVSVIDGDTHEADNITTGVLGKDVVFGCLIDSQPSRPGMEWLKDGYIADQNDGTKYLITVTPKTQDTSFWYNLTVKSISGRDTGIYTCKIKHEANEVAKSVDFFVDSDIILIGGSTSRGSKTWIWILVGILSLIILISLIVVFIIFIRPRYFGNRVATVEYTKPSPEKRPKSPGTTPTANGGRRGHDASDSDAPLLGTTTVSQNAEQSPNGRAPLHSTFNTLPMQYTDYPEPLRVQTLRRAQTPDLFSPRVLNQNTAHPYAYASFDPRRRPMNPVAFNFPNQQARIYSKHSGSMTSINSLPVMPRVPPGLGYVTLPRRNRIPSWSPNVGGGYPRTPLSPTGSLPPPMAGYRYPYNYDVPLQADGVGPRRTADGGSNLSLNTIGVGPPSSRPPSRSGFITPNTPITPTINPRVYRPLGTPVTPGNSIRMPRYRQPLGNNLYEPLSPAVFTFDPVAENGGPMESFSNQGPPIVPPKPNKRVSVIAEEAILPEWESIKGTEV